MKGYKMKTMTMKQIADLSPSPASVIWILNALKIGGTWIWPDAKLQITRISNDAFKTQPI